MSGRELQATGFKTSMRVVLSDVTIIEGTSRQPYPGHIVIDEGQIVDISTSTVPATAHDVQVVPCHGWTALPGLLDAHTHHGALDANVADQHRNYYDSYAAIAIGERLTQTLDRGFTTVRDAGGADAGFRLALRAGLISGPRLLVSGRPLSQTGGHGDMRRPTEKGDPLGCGAQVGQVRAVVDGVDEVRRAVREELRRGADQIKVMASGGVVSPSDRLESSQFSLEELAVACEEARSAGTYVLAHAYTPEAIRRCIVAGVRSIEHGNLLDEDTATEMAGQGQFLVPTLVAYEESYRRQQTGDSPSELLEKLSLVYDEGKEAMRRAVAAGVRIGSGSDLLGPSAVRQARELILQAEVQGPLGAIESSTRVNAELMGLGNVLGTLEVGKLADILVVDADLSETVEPICNPRRLRVIMQAGEFHKLTV
jgi:imidazolonepropionase-like amidohydrolase